jgi:hypothetical protein
LKKSNTWIDNGGGEKGLGTHVGAAWSATVMANTLFFLSSGMVTDTAVLTP